MPRATAHGSASAQIQPTGERRPDFALRMRGEVNDGRAAGIPGDLSPRPSSKGGRQVRTDIFLPAANLPSAADFRDRIVHHLFHNYTYAIFERTFIHDSYSCLKGRGTHYGISRLRHHILSESRNYMRPCHVMKVDVRGYFMHISRTRLLAMCRRTLSRGGVGQARAREIYDAYKGVPFLGAYLRPYRTYVSNGTLRRIRRKVLSLPADDAGRLRSSVNSFLGIFGHCDTFLQRRALFLHQSSLPACGCFSADCLRFTVF